MAYQDHLTRQAEQLGMILRRLLSAALEQGDLGEASICTAEATQALDDAFGGPRRTPLLDLPEDELLSIVKDHSAMNEANLDVLADLLMALARTHPDRAAQLYRQALALLEHINTTSSTFDLDRHAKVAQLKAML